MQQPVTYRKYPVCRGTVKSRL